MNFVRKVAATALAFGLVAGVTYAQDYHRDDHHDDHHYDRHDDHRGNDHRDWNHYDYNHYQRHDEWRSGYRMPSDYWSHGYRVDWRSRHLRQPPRGYEWREVDGNYIMAAAATGLIASVIMASH
jgi:Ni/Co efflux regulator RcnB